MTTSTCGGLRALVRPMLIDDDADAAASDFGLAAGPAECEAACDDVPADVRRAWKDRAPAGFVLEAARGSVRQGWESARASLRSIFAAEDRYWRIAYRYRPYVVRGASYELYRPAFAYGWRERALRPEGMWEDVEPDLGRGWELSVVDSVLVWEDAWHAARDAWAHVEPLLLRFEWTRGRSPVPLYARTAPDARSPIRSSPGGAPA